MFPYWSPALIFPVSFVESLIFIVEASLCFEFFKANEVDCFSVFLFSDLGTDLSIRNTHSPETSTLPLCKCCPPSLSSSLETKGDVPIRNTKVKWQLTSRRCMDFQDTLWALLSWAAVSHWIWKLWDSWDPGVHSPCPPKPRHHQLQIPRGMKAQQVTS